MIISDKDIELSTAIKLVCTNPASAFASTPFVALANIGTPITGVTTMTYPNLQRIARMQKGPERG